MAPVRKTVVFMGTPDFAVPSLDAIAASDSFAIPLVLTQPDKPRGRGKTLSPTPVKRRAEELGLDVLTGSRADYDELAARVQALEPDFIVVVAFGLILKTDLLRCPRHGCINLHASLLPRFRGVAPIQAAILAGDKTTGCTTIVMDEGIDTGDILLREEVEIADDDTAGTLAAKLASSGASLLLRTLTAVADGTVSPEKQDESLASYTKKIRKEDGLIHWSRSSDYLARLVRAMQPWPSAYTFFRGKRLIVIEASPATDPRGESAPGTILSVDPLLVACGTGVLAVARVKMEGKRAVTAAEFRLGYGIEPGTVLG